MPMEAVMTDNFEFYFDLSSPPSYIAYERLAGIVARTGATLILRPVLVGGVFKLSGNAAPVSVPAKRAYMMTVELPRLAKRYGIAIKPHAEAPFNSLGLMRGTMAADELGRLSDFVATVFRAQWAEGLNMANPAILAQALNDAGFDADALIAQSQSAATKSKLITATEAAVARGIFGVPTFFLGDEMFFGQYHLSDIEARFTGRS